MWKTTAFENKSFSSTHIIPDGVVDDGINCASLSHTQHLFSDSQQTHLMSCCCYFFCLDVFMFIFDSFWLLPTIMWVCVCVCVRICIHFNPNNNRCTHCTNSILMRAFWAQVNCNFAKMQTAEKTEIKRETKESHLSCALGHFHKHSKIFYIFIS